MTAADRGVDGATVITGFFLPESAERIALRCELIGRFIRVEATGGLLLIGAAIFATIIANGSWAQSYSDLFQTPLGPESFRGWINQLTMPGIFLVLALRLRLEWRKGQLTAPVSRRFAIVAAVSGLAGAAIAFLYVAGGDRAVAPGLAAALPADLAVALAVASLLDGKLLPQVRIVLTMILILGTVAAVILAAALAPMALRPTAMVAMAAPLAAMLALARAGVARVWPYALALLCLWPLGWFAGLPLSLVAVAGGLLVPAYPGLERIQERLHPVLVLGLLPLFGFANLGFTLDNVRLHDLTAPLTVALICAVFLGKPLGIIIGTRIAVVLGLIDLPAELSWLQLCGIAFLCGIGGSASLFLGTLGAVPLVSLTAGVMIGSMLAGALGFQLLSQAGFRKRK